MGQSVAGVGDLFIKNSVGRYVPLGKIAVGRIRFANGDEFTIGSAEDIFEISLTEEDKNLMAMMQIRDGN